MFCINFCFNKIDEEIDKYYNNRGSKPICIECNSETKNLWIACLNTDWIPRNDVIYNMKYEMTYRGIPIHINEALGIGEIKLKEI